MQSCKQTHSGQLKVPRASCINETTCSGSHLQNTRADESLPAPRKLRACYTLTRTNCVTSVHSGSGTETEHLVNGFKELRENRKANRLVKLLRRFWRTGGAAAGGGISCQAETIAFQLYRQSRLELQTSLP